ncbi:MAG: hypothetical protein CFH08_02100 [Alphaproteobacteria bacterium MarineAlpha3_Bin7]|nr:MAG: hypothetical protein CFH08_02100 [Alphaproteobacteria bacterium MarineAlpha3_Bin7]
MKPLNLVPIKPSINFLIRRQYFFVFSVILLLSSAFFYLFNGLNLGIDFKGGIMLEVRVSSSTNISQMRQGLSNLNLGEIKIQQFGADTDFLIRIQKQEGGEKAQQSAIDLVKGTLPNDIKYRRTEFVGPKVSKELYRDGILAVIFAIIGILAYIWFRFEWQFGLGAIIALTHDVITTIGVYALTGLEFNLSTVAAILTIAGYSINDTVVVYDRVRENLRKYKTLELVNLLNNSVNETLSRTIMTSVTTLLALGALYVLGGEVIRGFSIGMIWGVLIGTYSSICIAVPLLLFLDVKRGSSDEEGSI